MLALSLIYPLFQIHTECIYFKVKLCASVFSSCSTLREISLDMCKILLFCLGISILQAIFIIIWLSLEVCYFFLNLQRKSRFEIFINVNNFEMWDLIINDMVIPTFCFDDKVVNKDVLLWNQNWC